MGHLLEGLKGRSHFWQRGQNNGAGALPAPEYSPDDALTVHHPMPHTGRHSAQDYFSPAPWAPVSQPRFAPPCDLPSARAPHAIARAASSMPQRAVPSYSAEERAYIQKSRLQHTDGGPAEMRALGELYKVRVAVWGATRERDGRYTASPESVRGPESAMHVVHLARDGHHFRWLDPASVHITRGALGGVAACRAGVPVETGAGGDCLHFSFAYDRVPEFRAVRDAYAAGNSARLRAVVPLEDASLADGATDDEIYHSFCNVLVRQLRSASAEQMLANCDVAFKTDVANSIVMENDGEARHVLLSMLPILDDVDALAMQGQTDGFGASAAASYQTIRGLLADAMAWWPEWAQGSDSFVEVGRLYEQSAALVQATSVTSARTRSFNMALRRCINGIDAS